MPKSESITFAGIFLSVLLVFLTVFMAVAYTIYKDHKLTKLCLDQQDKVACYMLKKES